ncbi:hypothetical protein SAMN05518849_108134 [Sphingobium sp. AP50]|nr:DUF6678 family protein [Sphingobium sp. AP50]SEJ55127.1 hypothetical protein SAMN05518849_108134 [Sphingobium sp. AP50]
MNDTKWDEIRLAMHELPFPCKWRTVSTEGYQSEPDADWYYHFRIGGYNCISYLDILVTDDTKRKAVREILQAIHVPGEETAEGFRIYGYQAENMAMNYL